MKRKLLLLLCVLLTTIGSWADTALLSEEAGWSKITSLPATLSDYYFVFVDKDNDLMLFYNNGSDGKQGKDRKTMYYSTSQDPIQNRGMLWEIAINGDGWSIKSAIESTYFIQTEYNAPQYCHTNDNGNGDATWYKWIFAYTESGRWTIQNGKYPESGYIGPWDAAAFSNGNEVEGNKTDESQIGHFYIYAIKKIDANVLSAITYLESRKDRVADITSLRTKYSDGTYTKSTTTNDVYNDYKALEISALSSASAADYTSVLVNPSFEEGTMTGWIAVNQGTEAYPFYLSDCGARPVSSHPLTNSDGDYIMNYYGWSWSWSNTNGVKQTIPDMPKGKYRIEAILGGWTGWDLTLTVNSKTQTKRMTADNTGVSYSVDIDLDATADLTIIAKTDHTGDNKWEACFLKADNFRIYCLDHYYDALKTAIDDADSHTLGFDNGEYAPYQNVDALTALNAAKAVNQTAYNISWSELQEIISNLESATWTANIGEVDAVYNGGMAITNDNNPKGWTREDNGWGQQVNSDDTNFDYSNTISKTAWYYNVSNKSSYYGTDGVYTMPLKGSTKYKLKVKYCAQGGAAANIYATVRTGSTKVLDNHELGANGTKKFEEKSVDFTTGSAADYVLELKNQSNFYFTDVTILKVATDAEITALDTEISSAESKTPGFEVGEYAPYNNVDALNLLAAAKSVDRTSSRDVLAATEALNGATWTANTELMDAIYDGQFASYTEDELNKSFKENGIKFPGGWLHDNSAVSTTDHIRQIATFSSFEGGRAMFFHTGTVSYGQTTGYTMPLKANAVYKFSFQYAGWDGYGTNPPSISILNENNEGMALTVLPEGAKAPGNGSTRYTVYFATDATPGNYIFKYQSPGNTNSTIGDLSLIRVDALPFSASGSINYLPGTYSKVSVDRPMSSGTWNTLVIPVDMVIPGEWTVKEMDNFSESTLTFKNASSIVAGTPYLVKTTETIDNIIASNVEVKALSVVNNITKNGLTMKGVYANGTVPVSDGSATRYVVSGDYMYRVNSTVRIKPFRAYFELAGGNNAREIILNFNDDFTAINAIDAAENEFGAQKDGKYLIDGKIVIVKNGVKYGTNGQKLN